MMSIINLNHLKKSMMFIWLGIGLIISFYLLLPAPLLPPPDLPESAKSNEPGDTWQLPNVSAYYTDKLRPEALDFYAQYFSRSSFLNIPLPTYRLNHPPEYAKQVFIDTKQSYYLEEIIHPFRESLFVNGFEWENDVFTPPESRPKNILKFNDRVWKSKVSLKWIYSSELSRLIIFWSSWILFWFICKFFNKEIISLIRIFCKKTQ